MGIAILYPIFAQIALTFAVMIGMGLARRAAIVSGATSYEAIAIDNTRWPPRARQFANCYLNQYELPVIFYVLCLMALITRNADLAMVLLAWAFVAARAAHAYIHVTSNVVLLRGAVFCIGFVVTVIMMGLLLLRLLFPAP